MFVFFPISDLWSSAMKITNENGFLQFVWLLRSENSFSLLRPFIVTFPKVVFIVSRKKIPQKFCILKTQKKIGSNLSFVFYPNVERMKIVGRLRTNEASAWKWQAKATKQTATRQKISNSSISEKKTANKFVYRNSRIVFSSVSERTHNARLNEEHSTGSPKEFCVCVCVFIVAFYLTWLTRAFEWRVNQNKFNKIFTENVQFKICPNQNIYNKPQHSDTLITVGILASIENSFVCFVCRLVCRCLASPPKFSSGSETDGIVYVNIYVFVFDCFAVFVIQIMRIIFSGVLCLFYNVRVWVCMSLCKPKKSMRRYEISGEILVCLSEMKCRMFFHGKCFRFYFQCIAYKDIKINISRLQRENVRLPYETVFFRLLLLQFILW